MSIIPIVVAGSIIILLSGCSSFPKFPVDAPFLEESIETTVDSVPAQYYLNHYLQGDRINEDLDRQIDQVYLDQCTAIPSRQALKQISQNFSNDFAALFLADRLSAQDKNQLLQRIFHRQLDFLREGLIEPLPQHDEFLILLVPGWNYINNGHITGSDFAVPKHLIDQLKIESHLVSIPPTGSVLHSAEVIARSILHFSDRGKKIIIVGASSAGPSIHYTLGRLLEHRQLESVVAWLNIGGLLRGSPLIDHFQKWPQKLALNFVLSIRGLENSELMTLSVKQSRERAKMLHLPEGLIVINYVGLSLTGNLSDLSTYSYSLIADQGPNDGLTLLVDIIAPESMTLIATRSDHYFGEDPLIDIKTIAIVKTVIEIIEAH